ncbi:MAG TPA: LuxR C-terminal-related transcriptional regulator [Microlunatus sp.]
MSQWSSAYDPAWLALNDAHNDASVLARDLVAALHAVHRRFDPSIARLAAVGGHRLGATFVDALAVELANLPTSVVLVLDDLHQVSNREVVDDLAQLLLQLSDNVRVVVASRWDVPIGLERLRLAGDLVLLRSAELAFDADEATAMIEHSLGRRLTAKQAEALVARTGGWAAGLQMAALSLGPDVDVDVFIERFAGDDRLIVDYLTGEVLQGLDERTRSFLLRTSILESLTPGLCAAVTGDPDARSTLAWVADHGFFLLRTTPWHERFRYHQLFADLLRSELAAEDPAAEMLCRRAAASWLLDHHQYRSGIDQLLAAGAYQQAFAVLADRGYRLYEEGEIATLVRHLAVVHDSADAPEPLVAIHLLAAQVGADDFTAAAETYRTLARRDDLTPGERIAIDTLAAALGFSFLPLAEMRSLTDGVLRALPRVDPSSVPDFGGVGGADSCEAMATVLSAVADFFAGDLESSARGFERALELPGLKYPLWRVNALGTFALVRAWAGHLADAEKLAMTALDTARAANAMDQMAVVCAHLALAMVQLDRLEVGAAGIHLGAAASCVRRCRRPAYEELVQLQQVRHVAVVDGAERALEELRADTFPVVRRPVIESWRGTLEAQLLLRSGSLRQARRLLDANRDPAPPGSFDVLIAADDLVGARGVLDKWEPPAGDLRGWLEHDLREAVLTSLEGHTGAAGRQIADAAMRAESEGLFLPFVEAPRALGLLRTAAPVQRLHRARMLLDGTPVTDAHSPEKDDLMEQLTPREMIVLEYLPSRLGNDQIADALYVSVNTLKTHLRNIYRKLDAPNRDAAVKRASTIGLI